MSYDTSTSAQRVELLRCMEILSNLTRRVTIGSGNMGTGTADGDALCWALLDALSAMGYGGGAIDSNQVILTDDEYFRVYPNYPDTDYWYDGKATIVDSTLTNVAFL